MNPSKTIAFAALLCAQLFGQNKDVAYVRYFADHHNFLSNLSMMATERRGVAHLAVSYNEKKLPLKIEWMKANGSIQKREMLSYDDSGKLIERGEYDHRWKYLNLTVIGDSEPWSEEFRTWRFPQNEPLTFTDQRTYFTIKDGESVSKIIFETVDGQRYGQIDLDYDYLGSLAEERWRDLPSGRVIRSFKYKFDVMADVTQIWEFGHNKELLSHVAIDHAPADQLYKTPPPRTNNTLDEVEIITREITTNRVIAPFGKTIIPKTPMDLLLMRNGDQLMVDFINVDENGIQFRMEGESDILTIPLHRVRTLTSRMGDVIYPNPIRSRN